VNDLVTLSFTPKDLDYVCNLIAKQPWIEANPLIQGIQQQLQEKQRANAYGSSGPQEPSSPG
jgi:hypothetical protein